MRRYSGRLWSASLAAHPDEEEDGAISQAGPRRRPSQVWGSFLTQPAPIRRQDQCGRAESLSFMAASRAVWSVTRLADTRQDSRLLLAATSCRRAAVPAAAGSYIK